MGRVTHQQIADMAEKIRADRARLEASLTPEELERYDAAEAAEPDIFEQIAAEEYAGHRDLDEAERMTLRSLGAEGIGYLQGVTRQDYEPFNLDAQGKRDDDGYGG